MAIAVFLFAGFSFAKRKYSDADFGKEFGGKIKSAQKKLTILDDKFAECSRIASQNPLFMQSLVLPEVMRYNSIKDGIEAESLRTLYVELGKDYANFSIGIFQMKPSFAEEVEIKTKARLSPSLQKELSLNYKQTTEEDIRAERVRRLQDEDWQLIYLTAFTCICNDIYANRKFESEKEKLQWYATVYNAGFDKTATYIAKKITEENFYLSRGMPEKKFRYAAIAAWYYQLKNKD
ncbi:MAG: hypothetical protein WAT19_04935 [Ferruginibacter sp.]